MNIAYLILAHNNPNLISRMIRCLSGEESGFHIHIDRKADIAPFTKAIGEEEASFCRDRVSVHWGEYSMVEAILVLIRQALAARERYDYFILLSGSDFPLRSKEYINAYLQEHRGAEFISMVKMPGEGKPLSRINTIRYPSERPVYHFMSRALARIGLAMRDYSRYLPGTEPFSGSTWWALTREACQYLSDFEEKNQPVNDFFRNTFASDEMYFHTILGNSSFRSRIRRNFMYDDWTRQGGHPEPIGEKHLEWFAASEKVMFGDQFGTAEMLFARKFSENNLEIVSMVEEMIRSRG